MVQLLNSSPPRRQHLMDDSLQLSKNKTKDRRSGDQYQLDSEGSTAQEFEKSSLALAKVMEGMIIADCCTPQTRHIPEDRDQDRLVKNEQG